MQEVIKEYLLIMEYLIKVKGVVIIVKQVIIEVANLIIVMVNLIKEVDLIKLKADSATVMVN